MSAPADGWRHPSPFENGQLQAGFANAISSPTATSIRRNVYFSSAHLDVPVTHQLASLATRSCEAEPEYNVVQTTLELLQEYFAGYAFGARGFFKIVAELAFLREVDALCFLLLAELQAVAYDFGLTVFPVLAGGEIPLFDGALVGEALRAFEE